jgi:sialate O-acetylesterase
MFCRGMGVMHMRRLIWMVAALAAAVQAQANVALHGLFTDHMVLQRGGPVPVFGTATPGEQVTVTFARQSRATVADTDGRWRVELRAMKASAEPASLTVAGENTITLQNVVVGDVWVCSGQSNMEWSMKQIHRPEDILSAEFPMIRQFKVPRSASPEPRTDVQGEWAVCTPASVPEFTAVGYYFARRVHQETGVPIGLIAAAVGGTPIEPWIPPEGLARIPEDKRTPVSIHFATSAWHQLYFGMIRPLMDFPIKGVLWYQGESNAIFNEDPDREETYLHKKRALISSWREAWKIGDFPFYFVQLSSFQRPNDIPEGGDAWARICTAQLRTLSVPRTGMAVAIDLADPGNPGDIHPKNKLDVGERLALWALAKDYGMRRLVHSGPLYKAMKVEGGRIRISFDHIGSGLMVAAKRGYAPTAPEPEGRLRRFAIAGADRKWVWADAVIDGKTVVVSSPDVSEPVAVRYAFSTNPDGCNLYNQEGLPASPFRTDDW